MARVFRFIDILGCELHTINDPEDKLPVPHPGLVISIELSAMLVQSVSPEQTGSSAPSAYIVRVREVPAATDQLPKN